MGRHAGGRSERSVGGRRGARIVACMQRRTVLRRDETGGVICSLAAHSDTIDYRDGEDEESYVALES